MIGQVVLQLLLQILHVAKEALGHRYQRFRRPSLEPVDHCSTQQCRELPSPDTELVANGREAQGRVQELAYFGDKELPAYISRVYHSCLLDLRPHGVDDVVNVLSREETRNISRREHVIEKHKHFLVNNLLVGEQEKLPNTLAASAFVHES